MSSETTTTTEALAAHKPRMPLFELVARTLDVLAEIDLADGEVSAAADDVLRELGVSLEERAEAYAAVCRLLGEEAEACDRFVETYQKRAKRKRAHADALKHRLFEAMLSLGIKRITGPTATAAIQKSAPSLELLVAETEVPDRFARTRREVDKAAIKDALKGGEAIDWARLTQSEHLRFR